MQLRPLTRLRLAFLALGVALLTPLVFLMHQVSERLEAQQKLRHEMVAERIFDELERELTRVLAAESARPSSAYDETTRTEAWAPFVVGYFKTGASGVELLAANELSAERSERLRAAVSGFEVPKQQERPVEGALSASPELEDIAEKPKSSPEVLRKLNRGQEERQRAVPPSKANKASKSAQWMNDPFL